MHFAPGSAELTEQAKENLKRQVAALADRRLAVRGFTDSAGAHGLNDRLARSRACAVKAYLVTLGLSPGNIAISGRGGCCYVQGNNSHQGRVANRRAEITVQAPFPTRPTLDQPPGGTP